MSRRLSQLLAFLAALMLLAAACSDSSEDEGAEDDSGLEATGESDADPEEGTGDEDATGDETAGGGSFSLRIGEPESLLAPNSNESEGRQVLQALYTNLVEYDVDTSQPVNAVAESIETEDSTTFTITVADGWTFHNGEAVTANSFVDAWNWTATAANAAANNGFFSSIEGYAEMNPPAEG